MNDLKNIIRFYRDCYQHDLKGIRITNFISNSTSKRFSPLNNEFFHSVIDKTHVDTEWATNVENTLLLNYKEKALYAGTYFLKAKKSMLGRATTTYIPLYIHELELEKIDEVYFVVIADTYLNPDFIETMNSMDPDSRVSTETFEKALPVHPFGFEHLLVVERFFKEHFPKWDIAELSNYHDPEFNFSQHLSSLKKAVPDIKKIYSGLILGLFNRPQGSLGVINELNALTELTHMPGLLDEYFGLEEMLCKETELRNVYIPASLSKAQSGSIFKKDASPISMILGPPGTGKSFTIACLVLDAICDDQSVLVVSKNSQATRVVANIIEKKFGIKGKLVKADNQRYKRGLASRLSKMISYSQDSTKSIRSTLYKILNQQEHIADLLKKIIQAEEKELEWGRFYYENRKRFFSAFKDKWIRYRKSKTDKVWKLNLKLISHKELKNRTVKKYIRDKLDIKLYCVLKEYRVGFIKLVNALKEDNLTKLNERIHKIDFNLILSALPVWLTTTKQISNHLPLKRELFDLVIIDEASQCDIASFVPALYRAKKAVIVGDPQQLNHVSFLSDAKQRELRKKYKLDDTLPNYRTESVIDWTNQIITSQDQVTFLNDHYRSKPAIIRFSNERFYDKHLNILRSHPIKDGQESVIINYVEGHRDKNGVNEIEARAILSEINQIIQEYQAVDKKLVPTIGISSPIRAQVNFIKTLINKEFSSDVIRKYQILIGTPYHFQGEERDIMLISFAIDSMSHFGSINYLNKEDVFNVLITRARNKQYVYSSIKAEQLPNQSLIRAYLEYNHEYRSKPISEEVYDEFISDIIQFLKGSSYSEIYTSKTVSGVQIDLTVVFDGRYYCIDLIGYPGEFEEQFSARNIEILNRMNIPVHFIPYSCWILNADQTKKDLLNFLRN